MEFIDLKTQYKHLKKQIDEQIQEVLDSSGYIMGSKVQKFEEQLADYVGVRHAVSCSDGTAALQLIYMAEQIGQGDVVFCPAMTFIASIEPACLLGATPVFCDIDETSYNIKPSSLETQIQKVLEMGKLTPKAVVAVDFVGNPAEYEELRSITNRYGLILIEDAAQAVGASYKGQKCGSLGDLSATSFFPSKPLGCYGDGGAVFTNDDKTAELLRSLRVHGRGSSKYDNIRIGINSRLDTIQAAVLLPKLAVLEQEIAARQEVAAIYEKELGAYMKTPKIEQHAVSAYAQYILMAQSSQQREHIISELKRQNIPTLIYYPNPLHKLPAFQNYGQYGANLECAERYAECSFGVPFSPYLTKEDQYKVIEAVKHAIGKG